ncbi:unnamed protein product, partial [Staurois parvus]
MTRDCRHSTGDDQRPWTVQGMTRDCGQYRDDQRLWTVQEMTRVCGQYRDDQRLWIVQ